MSEYTIEAELPRLVFNAPECGHCGESVEFDDGVAWCNGCRVSWSSIEDGALSVPNPDREGTDVPCTIVPQPITSPYNSLTYGECILPSGHEGEHVAPSVYRVHESTDLDHTEGSK